MSRGSGRWTMRSEIEDKPQQFRVVDIGDGRPVKVEVCEMCGVAPSNVDDCGEFGNPECPCFGIGIEEYEARYGQCKEDSSHDNQ